jgi:Z1 domain
VSESTAAVVLESVAGMAVEPRPLLPLVAFNAQLQGIAEPPLAEVGAALMEMPPNSDLAREVGRRLRNWDHAESPSWGEGTSPNTLARRAVIYQRLAVPDAIAEVLNQRVLPAVRIDPVVISSGAVAKWLTQESASSGFYWRAYSDYLSTKKHWQSVDALDLSTYRVVANISNPFQQERYQAKGLVVGHVQSGKTANFAGVIAKAVDAGYRLIIVMTGTTNILRRQTQRRIDKELLGKEFVAADYENDPDWVEFVEHGGLPSVVAGACDWHRLTGPNDDFRLLGYGAQSLEFERRDTTKPINDPVNLLPAKARIVIAKKHAGILGKVYKDLRPYAETLAEIPALIIDDESDQASIDTSPKDNKKRTSVNNAIVKLLKLLPRAQYVGYTATPFANVFVNPDDAEDLFPKDFIIPLEPPFGYMGSADFHDLAGPPVPGGLSNEQDFVRGVKGDDSDPANLLKALDSFVLAGGLKLFREDALALRFKHHTMLVHVSQAQDNHTSMRDELERQIHAAGYRTATGVERLRLLYDNDYAVVSRRRGQASGLPSSFEDLKPYLGRCADKLFSEKHPVLIVNGTKDSDTPDFDRESVWKILVGGNKLSRGYTIEGLTVSYYRRKAEAADTLMQMGRWFGYREGFRDLVRLFVGRAEPKDGNGNVIDLYKAFEGACRDELAFRGELERYAALPGEERITPRQVPPIVQAHLLRPTSKNKMQWATLQATNLGGEYREPTLATSDKDEATTNVAALTRLLGDGPIAYKDLWLDKNHTRAFVTVVPAAEATAFLSAYVWQGGKHVLARDLEFLSGKYLNPGISSWAVLIPQLADNAGRPVLQAGGRELSVRWRSREQSGGRYQVYSEPDNVEVAKYICNIAKSGVANDALVELADPHRAVLLLYPVQWQNNEDLITVGFGLAYPPNGEKKTLFWGIGQGPAGA